MRTFALIQTMNSVRHYPTGCVAGRAGDDGYSLVAPVADNTTVQSPVPVPLPLWNKKIYIYLLKKV